VLVVRRQALQWVLILIPAIATAVEPGIVVRNRARLDTVEPDTVYIEPYLVVDPTDSRHLVVTAVAFARAGKTCSVQTFVSFDDGTSWKKQRLPSTYPDVADPWLAFGEKGEVYLSYLALDAEREDAVGQLLRSLDGGRNWKGPTSLPRESVDSADDHPTVAADTTSRRYSGNVYVVTTRNERRGISRTVFPIHVFTSTDRGITFTNPIQILPNDFNNINGNSAVLSDGSLVVVFAEVGGMDADRKPISIHQRIWVTKSPDGGKTFSNPFLVAERDKVASAPMMAIDSTTGPFRDRIYVVANESGNLHLWIGDEKGEKWRETVIPNSDEHGDLYHHRNPVVAVNNKGVIAISWPEHVGPTNATCSQVVLTASTDGGKTFLPKARVSNAPSCFDKPANQIPLAEKSRQTVAQRWQTGGDYFGLAAGQNGSFHLVWSDSSESHFTLWTATALVAPESTQAGTSGVEVTENRQLTTGSASVRPTQ
jgi:hypothetical protein